MFAIGIRYLTGYAVATDVSNREQAEWPPHPARIFMALAAAHFETGEESTERAALEWLETLGPPAFNTPRADRREVVTHYVPVNDASLPDKVKNDAKPESVNAGLSVLPQYRAKQPRTFPRVRLNEDCVYLLWPTVQPDALQQAAVDRLCAKVIRIGHSSSLVQMWVEESPPDANWSPAEAGGVRMRVFAQGTLDYLKVQFNAENVDAYSDLKASIVSANGKAQSELKRELAERFGDQEPVSRRPAMGLWQTYGQTDSLNHAMHESPVSGVFDNQLMIFTLQDGPVLGLESTWMLLTAVRDTILSRCDPTPEWINGHRPDGSPTQEAHLAVLPLAFVGHTHADGHLLGLALAFPKHISPRDRGKALRRLLYDAEAQAAPIKITLGSLGDWTLAREQRPSPPWALTNETWTGPARTWATVTPIILDRHPKADYVKQRERWLKEVSDSIAESCRRQGLPEPVNIDVDKTSWHRGAPRAVPGQGGFPLPTIKARETARQQVHAWLQFDQDIEGPLLLGAGRYRGYGLFKPWSGGKE